MRKYITIILLFFVISNVFGQVDSINIESFTVDTFISFEVCNESSHEIILYDSWLVNNVLENVIQIYNHPKFEGMLKYDIELIRIAPHGKHLFILELKPKPNELSLYNLLINPIEREQYQHLSNPFISGLDLMDLLDFSNIYLFKFSKKFTLLEHYYLGS